MQQLNWKFLYKKARKITTDSQLWYIVAFAYLLRFLPIWGGYYPFMFDHAKDSLVMMEMGTRFKPALVGAVTSIPGVFNGPLYYYLALPFNMVFDYHPFGSIAFVLFASVLSVIFAYYAFNKWTALLYAASIGLISTQQSAWSPYLTVFVMLPLVWLLLKQKRGTSIKSVDIIILALLISATFSFQTAFGVVLLPLVMLILFLLKIKITLKQVIQAVAAFFIFFIPWFAFELRHSFHQTKQIIAFIFNYSNQAQQIGQNYSGVWRVWEMGWNTFSSAGIAVTPYSFPLVNFVVVALVAGYFVVLLKPVFRKKVAMGKMLPVIPEPILVYSILLIGPFFLYLVLPAKAYYFVALYPVWVAAAGQSLTYFIPRLLNRRFQTYFLWFFVAAAVVTGFINRVNLVRAAQEGISTYRTKNFAVQQVYQAAQDQDFVSYHYVPEIYDYSYQHIYLRQIKNGAPVPVEFSYAPGESSYIQQKKIQPLDREPEVVYLIVEKPHYPQFLDTWWGQVTQGIKIEQEYKISDALKVYQGRYYTDAELELLQELDRIFAIEATPSGRLLLQVTTIKKELGLDQEIEPRFE